MDGGPYKFFGPLIHAILYYIKKKKKYPRIPSMLPDLIESNGWKGTFKPEKSVFRSENSAFQPLKLAFKLKRYLFSVN
jgi:hypothetical protein